jgi:lipopolysaccharide export LptBFGC system permease protein LptF
VHLARHGRPPPQKLQLEQRLMLQAAVLSVYFLSAVLTGWLFRHLPIAVGAVPALSLFLVAVHGILVG